MEAIVALPTSLFYNTGIQTYVWLLTNRKSAARQGKVQLIDASGERFWQPMRKALGEKRREITDDARADIVRIYAGFLNGGSGESEVSKIFDVADFGYRELRVERPLRLNFRACDERIARFLNERACLKLPEDEREAIEVALRGVGDRTFSSREIFEKALTKALKSASLKLAAPVRKAILSALSERDDKAAICKDSNGTPEPDPGLRDSELMPLRESWQDFIAREVLPFVPDAWVDESYRDARDGKVGRVGCEINFNRYFYRYVPPRALDEINAELKALELEIARLLKGIAA